MPVKQKCPKRKPDKDPNFLVKFSKVLERVSKEKSTRKKAFVTMVEDMCKKSPMPKKLQKIEKILSEHEQILVFGFHGNYASEDLPVVKARLTDLRKELKGILGGKN